MTNNTPELESEADYNLVCEAVWNADPSVPDSDKFGVTEVSVSDLTLRVDNRVATYKLGDKTYTVIRLTMGLTVPELAADAKAEGEADLNPWVEVDAYDAGIRVKF